MPRGGSPEKKQQIVSSIIQRQRGVEEGELDLPPLCIFPEGSTSNNTHLLQFKRGAFEYGGTVIPIGIKYDCPQVHVSTTLISDLNVWILLMVGWKIINATTLVYPPF